ncbi:Pex34 [Kluyveromyces lactis]|nr:Pex34 [Kluyveromyces lactis]
MSGDKKDDTEKLLDGTKTIKSLIADEDAPSNSLEDLLIDSLTSVSSFFDDLYLLRSFGIISDTNFLYQKLNKGDIGSKVWLVSLLLSIRRSLTQLYKLIRLKLKLRKECMNIASTYSPGFKKLVKEKILAESNQLSLKIRSLCMDLLQDLLYMIIVSIDIFKINLSLKFKRALELISSAATVLKFVSSSYQISL